MNGHISLVAWHPAPILPPMKSNQLSPTCARPHLHKQEGRDYLGSARALACWRKRPAFANFLPAQLTCPTRNCHPPPPRVFRRGRRNQHAGHGRSPQRARRMHWIYSGGERHASGLAEARSRSSAQSNGAVARDSRSESCRRAWLLSLSVHMAATDRPT